MLGNLYKEHGDGVHDLSVQVFRGLRAESVVVLVGVLLFEEGDGALDVEVEEDGVMSRSWKQM
jgi:hypothetical protein